MFGEIKVIKIGDDLYYRANTAAQFLGYIRPNIRKGDEVIYNEEERPVFGSVTKPFVIRYVSYRVILRWLNIKHDRENRELRTRQGGELS